MKRKPKIAVIDYGMGNLRSVSKALEKVGAGVVVTDKISEICKSDAVVFPGVGAFNDAIKNVKKHGFDKAIEDVIGSGRYFLGLCLGFQMLFDVSYENGAHKGLGVIPGEIVKFDLKGRNKNLKVPLMGWNTVNVMNRESGERMFKGIKNNSFFYFVHSYYGKPKSNDGVAAKTDYGIPFCSAVLKGNVWGCQFHPEKSGEDGLKLLGNFVREVGKC